MQRVPYRIILQRNAQGHIIKMTKIKDREKILKATREDSLVVQWLGLHASTAGTSVQSLVGGLRSHMPNGGTKKKKEKKKGTGEKQQIIYKVTPIRVLADFSGENLQARREWHDIVKVMKEENLQPRILYPARLSFRFDGETKSFTVSHLHTN